MIEELVNKISNEGGVLVSLLLLILIGIVIFGKWYIKDIDKKNKDFTKELVDTVKTENIYYRNKNDELSETFNTAMEIFQKNMKDVKEDLNNYKKQTEERERLFEKAVDSFNISVNSFQITTDKLNSLDKEIKDVKKDITEIKIRQSINK